MAANVAQTKALVVILNQTRGANVTLPALLKVGTKNIECDFAYCGAGHEDELNPYASQLTYDWHAEEPSDWVKELAQFLPPDLHHFLVDANNPVGLGREPYGLGLWTSGLIQSYFRERAMTKITALSLEQKYSWFFFIRSDFFFSRAIPSLRLLRDNRLVVMEGESYGGLNDRFLGVPSELIQLVRDMFDMKKPGQAQEIATFLHSRPIRNPENLLLQRVVSAGLLQSLQKVSYLGYCVRNPHEGTRGSGGIWCPRRKIYVKYLRELLLAKSSLVFNPRNRPRSVNGRRGPLDDESPSLHFRAVSYLVNKGLGSALLVSLGESGLAKQLRRKKKQTL